MYAALVLGESPVGGAAGPVHDDASEALVSTAREFSPRVERVSGRAVVCDVAGLERLFGDARAITSELRREAADRGVAVRVAAAPTRGAALLMAHAQPGLTVVAPGEEATMLAPLPIRTLDAVSGCEPAVAALSSPTPPARFYRTSPMQDLARARGRPRPRAGVDAAEARARYESMMEIVARWGVRTLGELAALPPAQLAARLGQPGIRLQRLARGEDIGPLVPLVPEDVFEARLDLEWPIEGLEPLSFVLGRLLEPVCAHLERRGRAAAVLTTTLRLVSRDTHVRSLQLPAAMRDPARAADARAAGSRVAPARRRHRRGRGACRAHARTRAAVLAPRTRAAGTRAAVHAARPVVRGHGTGPVRLGAPPRHAPPRRVCDERVRGRARAATHPADRRRRRVGRSIRPEYRRGSRIGRAGVPPISSSGAGSRPGRSGASRARDARSRGDPGGPRRDGRRPVALVRRLVGR